MKFSPLVGMLLFTACAHAQANPPAKLALLVGCSEYKHLEGKNLRGPKNDVRQLAQALTTRFGFPAEQVKQLVGDGATRDAILKALDDLAADNLAEGAQIVIAFSGHGTRVPIPENQDPLDAQNPEPDGYDEAFVAADAQLDGGEMKNLILDNELGERLQALRAKGAHVWAVFDCCHSGTLARGVGDEDTGEVSRELNVADLKIPAAKVKKADETAAKNGGRKEEPVFDSPAEKETRGSLVAFYAAQPFETAPDLPCPPNAPRTDEHYFGLLTYSTLQTLLRQKSTGALTYRELGQTIIGRYRAERGTRGPTPNFAGDLDREVLGVRVWPGRSQILLEKNGAVWSLNAGELQGLSAGSILAVYAAGDEKPSGHIKITRSTPTSADVEPTSHNDSVAGKLQAGMRCEVVSRRMGDLRLKLQVPDAAGDLAPIVERTHAALQEAADKIGEYVEVTKDAAADWQLRAVSPAEALADYHLKVSAPQVLLIRRGESASPTATEISGAGRVWRQYDPSGAKFRAELEADLHKVFTWTNLWRVAGSVGGELSAAELEVKVELGRLAGREDKTGGKPIEKSVLKNGDLLELRVTNEGVDKVWVTLVYLDTDFSVTAYPTQQLNRATMQGDAIAPIGIEVSATSAGQQGWLVIAESAANPQPDYQFLSQLGLGESEREPLAGTRAGNSPFETVALAIAGQRGAFRGNAASSPKNPSLLLRSWIVAPK